MGKRLCLFLLSVIVAIPAYAGEIVLPSLALERDAPVRVLYRTGSLATGNGTLSVKWTDAYGRVVEDRKIPVSLTDESEVGFELDLRRAVAMQNDLSVQFSLEGVNKKGEKDHREEDAQVSFVARPPDRTWWDYQIIMWQEHAAEQYRLLKTLGINAAMYSGKAKTLPEFLLKNDLRWYAENIATDFYSEYHRWFPDRPVNWKFVETKALYKNDPLSKEPFKRHPSLVDPDWLKKIHDRLVECARFNSAYRPLFYNLGDESGIADLAAFWDFDFSDQSLVGFRTWLKEQYGTLNNLNQRWGSQFRSWDNVTPDTTNEAMQRTDDNFSAWADFKAWMDISFAQAVKMGVDAVHSVDPEAYVALEGAQIPGWGGYDYSLLTKVLDAIEPYDGGSNIEIIRSLKPQMVVMITSGGSGPWEKHRVWYELLHGNRGHIIWDAKHEFVREDGSIGPRGREAEPYYQELRNGTGALLINSERQVDPIAIHYSPASTRIEWMLAQRPKGAAWVERKSSTEEEDNDFMFLRESYRRLIEDLGLQYNFVTSGQIEKGELLRRGYRVLILPRSSALSEEEANEMRQFVEQGGVLIAEGEPGAFDSHGRRLPKPLLSDLLAGPHPGPFDVRTAGRGKAIFVSAHVASYYQNRVVHKESEIYKNVQDLFRGIGIHPKFAITSESGESLVGVETHVFRNGGVHIVALQSSPQMDMPEKVPVELKSRARFEAPKRIVLTFPGEFYAYDVRIAKPLGQRKQLVLKLDPYEPTILSVSLEPMPSLVLSAPTRLARGDTGRLGLAITTPTPAAVHIFHVDIVDPAGKVLPYYSGNWLAPGGHAVKVLPLALNDSVGKWEIRAKDLLSGQANVATVEVF